MNKRPAIEVSRYIGKWIRENRTDNYQETMDKAFDIFTSPILTAILKPEVFPIFEEVVKYNNYYYVTPINRNISEIVSGKFYRYEYSNENFSKNSSIVIYSSGDRLLDRYRLYDKNRIDSGETTFKLYQYDSYKEMYQEMQEECYYNDIKVNLIREDIGLCTVSLIDSILYVENNLSESSSNVELSQLHESDCV